MLTTSSGPVQYMSQQYEKDDFPQKINTVVFSYLVPVPLPLSTFQTFQRLKVASHGPPSLPLAFLLLLSTPNYLPVFLSSSTSSSPYPRSLHWVSVQEVPIPELGDNQVLVKVEYAPLVRFSFTCSALLSSASSCL
ncbi:hypothetical protein C361_06061 [Cryptococcus neoformans Tu259-1]|uniref:Uncharacterized protein n=1 Tax=Cryptococcus neoformans Tu259-1 TaxID=1230072 RepID=A0A854QDV9_CRYNE|nr:hypothetical protein C361_06061 [Cryptococcus neoformans var. grubii Tu259-1]